MIDVCNFSSFGIWFSFAVSCEKAYHCVFHIRRVLLMNVMFLVAAKIHFGWHACDQFLGAGTMMLIFNFISIYNVHLLLHIPRIETGAFSLLYLCYVCFLNDVKVVHTDWHAKISGQFYNWIFSFKSALLENVELLSMSKFSTHDGTFDKRCTRWNFESLVWFQEKIFCPTNQKCNLLCSNLLSMHLTLLNPLQTQ